MADGQLEAEEIAGAEDLLTGAKLLEIYAAGLSLLKDPQSRFKAAQATRAARYLRKKAEAMQPGATVVKPSEWAKDW